MENNIKEKEIIISNKNEKTDNQINIKNENNNNIKLEEINNNKKEEKEKNNEINIFL